MAKLTVLPMEETIELKDSETVREALQRMGIEIETPCDGQGVCGQCAIQVEDPEGVPETPHKNITREQAAEGVRLACRVCPRSDLTVRLSAELFEETLILEGADFSDSPVGARRVFRGRIAPAARVSRRDDATWMRYDGGSEWVRLEDWEKGFAPKGLAIDLGTTTLVVSLLSLWTGEELATASALNPQVWYGHDVMTRIQRGSTEEGRAELVEAVREGLNRLIEEVCSNSESNAQEVLDVVIGGNTTMLQLAADIDPAPLGRVPFAVDIRGSKAYPAKRFGLHVNPEARVYVPPISHAFIGSDISAGLVVCEGFFSSEASMLFIDVGTNGEMALSRGNRWIITSTAAGPAFEGMGISSGRRAVVGAVQAAITNGKSVEFSTVGDAPPKGICGSGIIDLIAVLLTLKVLDPTGRMKHPGEKNGLPAAVASLLEDLEGKAAFRLGENVYFTQEDVRQVQLAKGAIRTAIDMLLGQDGSAALDKVVIAGAFGHALRPGSLEGIGMIPPGMAEKVSFAGNTSRLGCTRLLLDVFERRSIEKRMTKVEHLALVEHPEYMDRYIESMNFPSGI